MRVFAAITAILCLTGGGFACLYAYISFTDPRFHNARHGYLYSVVGLAALSVFVALWLQLR